MPVMVTARRQWRRKQSVSLQPRKRRSQSKKVRSKVHTQFCTFFDHLIGQCPGDQIFIGHGVLMMQKTRTPDLKKTKSVAVNKTGKVEVHITDNQSWNSCHKVASHHEFTSRSAKEPTKRNHCMLWRCTIHGHFSQNMVPLQSECTDQHICLLWWTEAWILLVINSRLVCSTVKATGYETTRTVF